MHPFLLILASLVAACAAFGASSTNSFNAHDDRIYLPAVPSLVFTEGQVTFSRKGAPHPQLSCVGGNAKDVDGALPLHVECYNDGLRPPRNAEEEKNPVLRFTCIPAPASREFEMRKYAVKCEGYAYEEDLYVVKGSCYLEFEYWKTGKSTATDAVAEDDGLGVEEPGFFARVWSFIQSMLLLVALIAVVYLAQKCRRASEGNGVDSEQTGLLSPATANASS